MGVKEDREYEKWLGEVKSKLPAAKQALIDQVFASDDTKEVGLEIYRGHLGQSEIGRRMSEIDRAKKDFEVEQRKFGEEKIAIQKWFNDELPKNQRLQRDYASLAAERDRLAGVLKESGVDESDLPAARPVPQAGTVSGDDMDRMQRQVNQLGFLLNTALPQVMKRTLTVADKAIREGWKVNGGDIFDHALKTGVAPEQAFDDLVREQREERAAEREKKMIETAKEEGRREVLARGSSPDHLGAPGPSSLDSLRLSDSSRPSDHRSRVEAALESFGKLTIDDPNPMMPVKA